VSVTVYRAPDRGSNALDLDRLQGFALITEQRLVSLPAGESQVRFEGVADGIEAASAILSDLPGTLLEKNRDARVLSPSALVAATVGHTVELVRTNRKSGRQTRVAGTLRADNDGVVFESPEGVEALRCSGLPETFQFSGVTDLRPSPTLSVVVRTEQAVSAQVTLSYLARGFDWTASYTARLSPDARKINLGAWVTLANSNAVAFPSAHAQIVAGRLNRETREGEPVDQGGEILAQCWPQETTSELPPEESEGLQEVLEAKKADKLSLIARIEASPPPPPAPQSGTVMQEQLGDLKLYRVPERTTVSNRQMKQVRLLDREAIPVTLIYSAETETNQTMEFAPAQRILRTKNDAAHHLGLPLPSGVVDIFTSWGPASLFLDEAPLRDIAVDEEVEIPIGEAPDVQVRAVVEARRIDPSRIRQIPLIPGVVHLRSAVVDEINRIEIENATGEAITFEARLRVDDGVQLIRAVPAPAWHRGQRVFRVEVPAAGQATIRYQTGHVSQRVGTDGLPTRLTPRDAQHEQS
jgi:hypothetical protein